MPAPLRPTLFWLLAVFILDQLTKWQILGIMEPPRRIEITSFFNLVLTYNTGVSFGMLGGESQLKAYLLAGFAIVVSIALIVWRIRKPEEVPKVAAGFIAGGALGNALDRFVHPGVVDFLDFHISGYHWPAFNVADAAIVTGVGIWLLFSFFPSLSPEAQQGK